MRYWIIVFEDKDHDQLLFNDEKAARKAYDFFLANWSCHLFKQVSNNGKEIS